MKFLNFIGIVILLFSCTVEPEPLVYGTDVCYTCKMTLMDKRFGAEIVTKKGKVYKFDDINCFIQFHNSGNEPEENMAFRLVVDFDKPGNLMDAVNSFYIKSDTLRTPMASKIAAFSIGDDYKAYKKKWNGILLSWGEIRSEFK